MHSFFARTLLALTMTLSVSTAYGQVATGTYPFGTYDNPGIDTINVGNLNSHITLPVINKSGRGIPFNYAISYDSSIWTPTSVSGVLTWQPVPNWGWRGATEITTGYLRYGVMQHNCYTDEHIGNQWIEVITGTYEETLNYVYHDPWGGSHPFSGTWIVETGTCGSENLNTISQLATDGSGYQYSNGNIIDKSGKLISPPHNLPTGTGSITDLNGNQITVNGSGQFTDTTGNVALTVAGGASSPETFTYKDTSGNSQTVTINYSTYAVQTAFGCSGVNEYASTSVSLVSSVTYPDGSAYTFSYEPTPGVSGHVTGRIASIELPQGGVIDYTYSGGSNGIICADGSTAGLTRSIVSTGGSAASNFTYTRTITGTGTSKTAVLDGLGNNKIYQFVEASNQQAGTTAVYYETSRQIYQGAATGTPVLARNTCYNNAAAPCTTTLPTVPFSQVDTYQTLNGLETNGTTAVYNAYGMQTQSNVYDFGASSRGSLLRKEVWTYGYSIAGLPTQDEVFDGSGNEAGNTVFAYDQTTPTASSGVPQHVAVTGARGNLTTATQYASSTVSYTQTATYEDTGSLLTLTSPTGTTTYAYDPTFVYQTGSTQPTPSSGVVLQSSATFDATNSGVLLSSTDFNSQISKFTSYDTRLRPTELQFPDDGMTTWSYSPTTLTISSLQTSSVSSSSEIQYDAYGRTSRAATANGQSGNGYYQKDTCYDANGRVTFSSYRYQGPGFSSSKICSGNGDTFTYDVLGRTTSVVRGNGETKTYTYLGRAKKSINENGVTRISQGDSLGRTTIVCEISSNGNMPGSGSPVSCGTDISGTGFTTSYAYNLANHTSTSTQGAQSRSFQTDWLGRTIAAAEPESGATTYSYAYNSTGLAITRTRPKANQTSTTVYTTTVSQYDSLGRLLTVTYSDGTPTKTFSYDKSAGWSDLTQNNLKGRRSYAGVTNAQTIYGYDPMGRTTDLDECLPSGCGNTSYDRKPHYAYDLSGNVISYSDGAGAVTTYTRSQANEITGVTSSLSNSTNPASLVTNVSNGPFGPTSYNLGNGLTSVRSYDALGRTNGGWVCEGSSQQGCTGGTQIYGFTSSWTGAQMLGGCDTELKQCVEYGYDEFNRLTSRTVTTNPAQNFTYVYDRYGNRWQQNFVAGSGDSPAPQLSFNTANNQITSSGFAYDAAGNVTNDGYHTYTYDAEGNITAVDGGTTAQYVYDALNHRVRKVLGSTITEYVFNSKGRRVSSWNGSTYAQIQGQYFAWRKPLAFYSGGSAHFQHQDWLGNERVRTSYDGVVEGSFGSLPFGDGQITSGTDADPYHFAELDSDTESNTSHAQFRQYSSTQGRWLRPDPYAGSYRIRNPQSFNRYAYVMNRPLSATDKAGLEDDSCDDDDDCDDGGDGVDNGGPGGGGAGDGAGNSGSGNSTPQPGSYVTDENDNVYYVNSDGSLTAYDAQEVDVSAGLSSEDLDISLEDTSISGDQDLVIYALSVDVDSDVTYSMGIDPNTAGCNYALFMGSSLTVLAPWLAAPKVVYGVGVGLVGVGLACN